jgi:hypothetical protein
MSQKSTVKCRRSLPVTKLSEAITEGGSIPAFVVGSTGIRAAFFESLVPHSLQKLLSVRLLTPQHRQVISNAVPHCVQKRPAGGLSALQLQHFIKTLCVFDYRPVRRSLCSARATFIDKSVGLN